MSDNVRPDGRHDDVSAEDVFARVTDAVFASDGEWRLTYLNERAERVFDSDPETPCGGVVWEELPDAVASTFRPELERAMETQDPVTFEAFHPPLDTWFEVRAYPSETGLSVYLRDISDRVGKQDTLESREESLRRAYEVIADPDLSFPEQVDALLDVVRNAVGTDYATLSHVRGDRYVFEAVACPDDADLQPGDAVPVEATNCERVVATERTLVLNDVETDAPELADRAGNAEWGISCYLGAPVTVDGEPYGTFCFYDMEARSADFSDWEVTFVELLSNWVSAELERQRQNERLESFASMLAHELRNPLTIAQLYSDSAADGDAAAAEEVAAALDRIEELIDVLLVIARGSDSEIDREAVELADVAAEAWADVAADESEFAVETDRSVAADPIHLQHLLENLFRNAVEHGSTSRQPMAEDVEGNDRSGVTVRVGDLPGGFYVADDGTGIPEEEREKVFESGYTTGDNGMGLGLTFVTQLANAYGWTCAVTDSDEGGARFEFTDVDRPDGTADGERTGET
ncbi:ATP-binding protein [Halorussus sp. AFM4]|uniref:sensor histidine kinase n=1 Tax=Halorussus sp. AFM4 TaxID=3421651 RepID=UPI003EBFAB35